MKVLIDIKTDSTKAYPYKTSKLGRVFFPVVGDNEYGAESKSWESFGINDSYFGGNIHKIAEVKGKPFYILSNKDDETIGIMHTFDRLDMYTRSELIDLCKMQSIVFQDKDNKQDLIKKLLELRT